MPNHNADGLTSLLGLEPVPLGLEHDKVTTPYPQTWFCLGYRVSQDSPTLHLTAATGSSREAQVRAKI